jgi:hypothetical protein
MRHSHFVAGVWMHPRAGSQASFVQRSPSSQSLAVCVHVPIPAVHASTVHAFPSSHAGKWLHAPLDGTQESTVQGSPSPHWTAECEHAPDLGSHASRVHPSKSSQAWVCRQVPVAASQKSFVQGLPSSAHNGE